MSPTATKWSDYLVSQHERLLDLRHLDLTGSNVSDAAVRQLSVFRRLAELNLNHTPITWEGLHVVRWLPELESVYVEGTNLKWLDSAAAGASASPQSQGGRDGADGASD